MSLKQDIANWNKGVEKDLIKNYEKIGLKASGNWGRSLAPVTKIKPTKITVSMLAPEYTGAMTDGRKPGNMPPVDRLAKWVVDKPVAANPWAVSKTIAKLGTLQYRKPDPKKTNLIKDVVTDKRVDELVKIVGDKIFFDIKAEIKSVL